jgi:hypothetical protein
VAYETFERTSIRVEDPALTVAAPPDGRIFFNAAASRVLEKAGVRSVRILWDKTTCGLGLLAAQKSDKNSYSIVFSRGGRQATFSAKAFLRHIGWSADARQTIRATWDERQKMLEAKLPPRFVRMRERKDTKGATRAGQ